MNAVWIIVGLGVLGAVAVASVISPQRNLDWASLFNAGGLRHAAQSGNRVSQAPTGREDRDDVAKPCDLEIHICVGVGELRRDTNGLAIAGFEYTGPRHRSLVLKLTDPLRFERYCL